MSEVEKDTPYEDQEGSKRSWTLFGEILEAQEGDLIVADEPINIYPDWLMRYHDSFSRHFDGDMP